MRAASWDAAKGDGRAPDGVTSAGCVLAGAVPALGYLPTAVKGLVLTAVARCRVRPPGLPAPDSAERQLEVQPDALDRLARATVRAPSRGEQLGHRETDRALLSVDEGLPPARCLTEDSRARWLLSGPFRLVLGSGLMGMFEHLGRVQALDRLGIVPADLVGVSSGAILGAMASTMPLCRVEAELLGLSIVDFLDPSVASAWRGAVCEGVLFESTLARLLQHDGRTTFEETRPPLQVAVYNLAAGRTELIGAGPLAPAVCQSAALPMLFAPRRGKIDGGWMDDQGRLWLEPGRRALQSRLPTGYEGEPESWFTRPLDRRRPVYSLSGDPAHLTLLVDIEERLRAPWFMFEIDGDPGKARYLVEASYEATLSWLLAPVARGPAAGPSSRPGAEGRKVLSAAPDAAAARGPMRARRPGPADAGHRR